MTQAQKREKAVLTILPRQHAADFFINECPGGGIDLKDIRVPGFHPAVKNNWRLQPDMKSMHGLTLAMDVGGWLKAGEKGPEKFLQRTGRLYRGID